MSIDTETNASSATILWAKVLDLLRKEFSENTIETFFSECTGIKYADGRLFIHTPINNLKPIIEERYKGFIRDALNSLFSSDDLDVVILDDEGLKAMKEAPEEKDYLGINEYTFEHFVVGGSNILAHGAAVAVANGDSVFNPLFIYGDSGLGKTHLLYAIRHEVLKKFPHYKVVYVKGEEFMNDYVFHLRKGKNIEFREKYRNTDYFLIDDIQFISGKIGIQEEYFNTFNTLFELGKRIVLTSDRPPNEMLTLESRLRTRFGSGLVADIKPPDEVLRLAIIRSKAEQLGVILPDEVITFIADNIKNSVRELEGAVKMAIAFRDLVDEEISVANLKARIKDAYLNGNDFIPSVDSIINETAKYFMLTSDDLKGRSRFAETKNARHIAMYLIRYLTNLSLEEIGKKFGNMHHTTVRSAVINVEKKKKEDSNFDIIIKNITSDIKNRSNSDS